MYAVQWEQPRRRQAEREAAQRPVCTSCGAKFTDDRWKEVRGRGLAWGSVCGLCMDAAHARAEAERAARRQSEEADAHAAAEPPAAKSRGGCGIGRRR
ncbi:hypothetical protein [Streptomyces triculaminicus]|uniref:hypothetical protein n=1 Tax=Streptomyces triculaminicus TaxID=2816232 RepID=UPI0037D98264